MTVDVYQGGFSAVPHGARCFALKTGSKVPASPHAHLDAVPVEKFAPLGNYGIALDGQFVLVDFDADHPGRAAWEARLPATWMQQTRRGVHRLYRIPDGWTGKNAKIAVNDGEQAIIGDLKCNGYLVGPGSVVDGHTYVMLDTRDPAPAPPWLLDLMERKPKQATDFRMSVDGHEIDRTKIELGRNDAELTSIAGFLRHRGFGETAIATMLAGVIDSGILEQDPTREAYTHADAARIARSVSKYEGGTPLDLNATFKPESWACGANVPLVGAPIEWWLHGFVPKGQLCLMYGAGGIGKSTWASWLAAQVTRAGGTFVHVGVEEPFRLFLARAVLLGADRSKLFGAQDGSGWRFPRDAEAVGKAVEAHRTGVLYFDSIYTHFEASEGSNAAERARAALGPLAELAQRVGTTVLGVFHENKAGEWLGSTEMLNVGRTVLHATRPRDGVLRVAVKKTNNCEPSYAYEYEGVETPWIDPATGEVQREYGEDGTLELALLVLPGEAQKIERNRVSIDTVNRSKKERAAQRQLDAIRMHDAGKSLAEIANNLGLSRRTVARYLGTPFKDESPENAEEADDDDEYEHVF